MTVLTKPSSIIKKPDVTIEPIIIIDEEAATDESIEHSGMVVRKKKSCCKFFRELCLNGLLLVLFSVMFGLMIHRIFFYQPPRRFHGFCSVSLMDSREDEDFNKIEPNFRVMSLRWPSDEMQVLTPADDTSDNSLTTLREQLEIDADVETISVINDGHPVSFIHDFEKNFSSIVDASRCFVLELDPLVVLAPAPFLAHIESRAHFDTRRVRTALCALLPALDALAARLAPCAGKPLYRLEPAPARDDEPADGQVHKRSAEQPKFNYIQFSGKQIQEIEITNMADLLDYEKNNKK